MKFIFIGLIFMVQNVLGIMFDELPFPVSQNSGCELVASGVLIINCQSSFMIYNSKNFIKYGNKGVNDYGSSTNNLTAVHKIVER